MSARNPDAPAGEPPKRLTDDQVAQIIEDRLDGYSVRETAARNDVTPGTVHTRYRQWLDATTEERRAEMVDVFRSRVTAATRDLSKKWEKAPKAMKDRLVDAAADELAQNSDFATQLIESLQAALSE